MENIETDEELAVENSKIEISREEIDKAIGDLKKTKAVGIDEIPVELLKAAQIKFQDRLFELLTEIYETRNL